MYFLAYRWTGNRLAASVAGVVFASNGLTLNLLMWPSHIATLSWMAWVVLSVERAWQEGRRQIVVAALVGALQMLAGGPEIILFTWLILLVLWMSESKVAKEETGVGSQETISPKSEVRSPKSERRHVACGVWRVACRRTTQHATRFLSDFAARWWRFPLVGVLVAGLAAAQLLPFLDLAAHSQREQGYADARWSMPGWGWANFLVPMVFGSVWNKGVFFQYEQAWTSSYYLGVGALLLALLGAGTARDRRARLLTIAAVAALLLAFGDQFFLGRWLRHVAPQLSLMTYPVKFVVVVTFAAPLLAGYALARLQSLAPGQRRDWAKRLMLLSGLLLALIAAILLWAWRWPFPTDDSSATLRNGLGRAAFLAAVALVLLLMLRRGNWAEQQGTGAQPDATAGAQSSGSARWCGGIRAERELCAPAAAPGLVQRLAPLLLLLLLWLDTWTHEPPQNPVVPGWIYSPGLARTRLAMKPQPALGESRAMLTAAAEKKFMGFILSDLKDNFLVKRLGYFADCNLLDEVPKVNGFFSLYPRECGELNSVLYNGAASLRVPRLADFLAVSQVTRPGEYFEWEPRATFLPLATAGQAPVFLDDTNAVRRLVGPDFDGRRIAFLPPDAKGLVSVTGRTQARVMSSRFTPQRVELGVEAAEPSLVVVAQTWYHWWRAYVDGAPVRLLRANYAFQAVEVPAGRHQVRLTYQDKALYAGAVISGCMLLFCLVAWARLEGRRPKAEGRKKAETRGT